MADVAVSGRDAAPETTKRPGPIDKPAVANLPMRLGRTWVRVRVRVRVEVRVSRPLAYAARAYHRRSGWRYTPATSSCKVSARRRRSWRE